MGELVGRGLSLGVDVSNCFWGVPGLGLGLGVDVASGLPGGRCGLGLRVEIAIGLPGGRWLIAHGACCMGWTSVCFLPYFGSVLIS